MSRAANQKNYHKISASDFIIRVKSGQGAAIKGKIEHIKTGRISYFNDFLEMLLIIQDKLDQRGYPQCDTEMRRFCSKK